MHIKNTSCSHDVESRKHNHVPYHLRVCRYVGKYGCIRYINYSFVSLYAINKQLFMLTIRDWLT